MNPFKVGDRVRLINPAANPCRSLGVSNPSLPRLVAVVNKEFTVKQANLRYVVVDPAIEDQHLLCHERFVLVPPAPRAHRVPKVGDIVAHRTNITYAHHLFRVKTINNDFAVCQGNAPLPFLFPVDDLVVIIPSTQPAEPGGFTPANSDSHESTTEGAIMSQFAKTRTAPVAAVSAVAGSVGVTFYVNIIRKADGSIEPGARTYRKLANAQSAAEQNTSKLVETKAFTVTAPLA